DAHLHQRVDPRRGGSTASRWESPAELVGAERSCHGGTYTDSIAILVFNQHRVGALWVSFGKPIGPGPMHAARPRRIGHHHKIVCRRVEQWGQIRRLCEIFPKPSAQSVERGI